MSDLQTTIKRRIQTLKSLISKDKKQLAEGGKKVRSPTGYVVTQKPTDEKVIKLLNDRIAKNTEGLAKLEVYLKAN